LLTYLSIMACGLVMGTEGEDAAKRETARMEGTWSFASVEVDGAKQPEQPFAANKIIILKDGGFVIVQGSRITHGTLKPDPSKTPKEYDSTITDGPAKDSTFKCIYELEGDSFKLCGSYRGGQRPTEFVTKPGSGLVLQVLKREKQSVKDALAEAARKELAGTWQSTSLVKDGTAASEADAKKMTLTIDEEGKATEVGQDGASVAAAMVVDPSTNPMTIDITYAEGEMKGRTAPGIYRLENDILTVCRAATGGERPSEFSSKAGRTLVTYRRESPETK